MFIVFLYPHSVILVFLFRGNQRTLYPFLRQRLMIRCKKNCHPISLTPVLSKVLERIVKDKLLAYISAHHVQDPNQHGFVSKRSVISNLLISDSILTKSLDHNISVNMILFNFSKAFDRVSQSLLLHRLKL